MTWIRKTRSFSCTAGLEERAGACGETGYNSRVSRDVVDRDWVFFDQRGTGRSSPALYCPPGEDYFARLRLCRDQLIGQGIDPLNITVHDRPATLRRWRKALGVNQWNLVGGFLRTRLAFTVARYFPSSVCSIVHDGPYLPEDQEVVEDLRGTEVVLNKLFSKRG